MMYGLILAAFLAGAAHAQADLQRSLSSAPTETLAVKFLPPDVAPLVVKHRLTPLLPGSSGAPYVSITFYGRPMATKDGFCERKLYHVSYLSSAPTVSHGNDLRLGNCPETDAETDLFAHLQPGAAIAPAKRALRWLEWARGIARAGAPVPFELKCRSETEQDRCAGGAAEALAQLPLEKTYIVSGDKHSWGFAIAETKPGVLLWDVDVDTADGASSISLTWKMAAPF